MEALSVVATRGDLSVLQLSSAVALGAVVGSRLRLARTLVSALVFVLIATMAVDLAIGGQVASLVWGPSFTPTYDTGVIRARGFIGQPVPAAAIGVALCAFLSLSSSRGVASKVAFVVLASLLVVWTGTRSAWFAVIALLVLLIVQVVRSRSPRSLMAVAICALIGCAAGLVASSSLPGASSLLGRSLDFGGLEGSDSLVNRSAANAVFDKRQTCSAVCWLVGSGVRSLQASLSAGSGLLGYVTVDNFYVTLLWDLGIVGLALFVLSIVLAVRRAFTGYDSLEVAAASALVMFGVSGFFFDALYVRSCVLVFGLLVGVVIACRDARGGRLVNVRSRAQWDYTSSS
jgi:hypothetical protein